MKKISFLFFSIIFLLFIIFEKIFSFSIHDLPQTETKGDFVLSPGKIEVWLAPGEKTTKEITVTNRTGREAKFLVEVEDFKGSRDPEKTVVLLGEEKGPYSLKDFIKPEVFEFTLKHGQRIVLPIEISIPPNAEPGGRYGAVIVGMLPEGVESKENVPVVSIVARLGNLFFVRVKGLVKEVGFLKDFLSDKKFYQIPKINFKIYFENNGNVHLIPYGLIEIRNILGKKVAEIDVEPFFVLPDSLRLREIKFEGKFLFGKYKATLLLNRGYQNIIDQKQVEFWVFPWRVILPAVLVLIFILIFLLWIFSHFEIRRKK